MTKYRNKLPQLADKLFLTDGGLETTLIFHDKIELPYFASFDLLRSLDGTQRLRDYFERYIAMAKQSGTGFVLEAPTWREFKERIYALHQLIFAATKNRFLIQIMSSILADRRAVVFDGKDTQQSAPLPVRQQTHDELAGIVNAISHRKAKLAQKLTNDHLVRMMATINIWQ